MLDFLPLFFSLNQLRVSRRHFLLGLSDDVLDSICQFFLLHFDCDWID